MKSADFWTGASVTDWVSAIGGLAGFAALLLATVHQRGRRRRPPDDLLDRLLTLESAFGDIIAGGGQDASWFLTENRRREESLLAAIAGLLVDDELNRLVGEARRHYQDCFSVASGHGILDPARQQEQVEFASEGRRFSVQAIDRMNELFRRNPP